MVVRLFETRCKYCSAIAPALLELPAIPGGHLVRLSLVSRPPIVSIGQGNILAGSRLKFTDQIGDRNIVIY